MKDKISIFFYVLLGFVVLLGLAGSFYFGLQPKTVPKIKVSAFKTPEVASEAIFMRLNQEIQATRILFAGLNPDDPFHVEIWKQFIAKAQSTNAKFDFILFDRSVTETFQNPISENTLDLKDNFDSAAEKLKTLLGQNKRILVIAPHVYMSLSIHKSMAFRLKNFLGVKAMSVEIVHAAQPEDNPKMLEIPCSVGENDLLGTGDFGCLIFKKSKQYWAKMQPIAEASGFMDLIAEDDYLMILRNKTK